MFLVSGAKAKITTQMKRDFLDELSHHGNHNIAARKAGMTPRCAKTLMEKDQEFMEAVEEAFNDYRERVISLHQKLIFEGELRQTFDRQGNLISEERVRPIPLIQMELRKVDRSYTERKETDVRVSGGVMVAPASVASIDDWEAKFAGYQPPKPDLAKPKDDEI